MGDKVVSITKEDSLRALLDDVPVQIECLTTLLQHNLIPESEFGKLQQLAILVLQATE